MKVLSFSLVMVAACGGDPATVAPDAPVQYPPGSGPITVYAPYSAGPAVTPGATILIYDVDGTLLDRQLTNGAGRVAAMAPPGATVTAVPPPGTRQPLYSWVDVQPGDQLFTMATVARPVTSIHSLTVELHDDGADAYAYEAALAGYDKTANTSTTMNLITLTADLAGDAPPNSDLVATATHSGHKRFVVMHDVSTAGPTIDVPDAWQDALPLDLAIENIPADAQWVSARYTMDSHDRPVWIGGYFESSAVTRLPLHFDSPGVVGDRTTLSLLFQRGAGSAEQFWGAAFNGRAGTLDLATYWPPNAAQISMPGGAAVFWEPDGDPLRATAALVSVEAASGSWLAIVPGNDRAFQPPPLPADLPQFGQASYARVTYTGTNDPAGYAAVRTDPLAFDPYQYAQVIPSATGGYRIAGH